MAVAAQKQQLPRASQSKFFTIFYYISLVSASCAPSPIPIRIGNVTLSNSETARGLDISVGTPAQPFAFLPQWPLNNTFVYGTSGFCSTGWTSAACVTFRGGQYDQLGSKTRGIASINAYPADASPYPQCNYVTDIFTLSSNITLGNFPIGVAQADWGTQGYFPQMALGLGSNSTVLNTLKSTGQIASRSWSMFWGRTGATANTQLDGNFVFGGYDRAKVMGPNYTRSLSTSKTACTTELLVTITDMILNFPNGTDASLFGGAQSSALAACIVPTYPVLMTIPTNPYFDTFEFTTGEILPGRSLGLYYYGMLYGTGTGSTPYGGDLTIKLDSGLSVRVPNDQLVVPDVSIDPTSGALIANASTPELVLNAIQSVNANDLPQLGRQFLTAAYLMVNQDANQFTLWEANPTANEDLVAVDVNNGVVDSFCAASAASSSTASAKPGVATSTGPAQNNSNRLSSGAIAGIAAGSVAIIAAIVGFLIFFLIKRRKAGSDSYATRFSFMKKQEGPGASPLTHVLQYIDHYKAELESGPVLCGTRAQEKHEVDGRPTVSSPAELA
ncbi:acid protease [Cadophora sp. DSE1049]|nr:acid protease [Cadophora sp. DSE1049]